MRYFLILIFMFASVIGQSLFQIEESIIRDYKTIQGEIVLARSDDSLKAFQRFTFVRTLDTLIDLGLESLVHRTYIYCTDKKGKQFRFRVNGNSADEFYNARLFEDGIKKLRKGQYVYFEKSGLLDNFVQWGIYKFEDAFYDPLKHLSKMKLRLGKQVLDIAEFDFSRGYFIPFDEYSTITRKFGQTYGRNIIQGEISLGMTPEMVIAAWGRPNDSSEYISTQGTLLTYQYRDHFVTFMNNKVSSIYRP